MLIVVRVVQALLMLAALACGIGGVVVVGGLVNDTESACQLTDADDDEDGVTAGCATIPNYQAQATVGLTYALVSVAMMIGAAAMNGAARPAGGASATPAPVGYAGQPTGPFPQQSAGPFAPPPAGPLPPQTPPLGPPHPGQPGYGPGHQA